MVRGCYSNQPTGEDSHTGGFGPGPTVAQYANMRISGAEYGLTHNALQVIVHLSKKTALHTLMLMYLTV